MSSISFLKGLQISELIIHSEMNFFKINSIFLVLKRVVLQNETGKKTRNFINKFNRFTRYLFQMNGCVVETKLNLS